MQSLTEPEEPEEAVYVTPEEEAELLEAIAEADRGETISREELFARLPPLEDRRISMPCQDVFQIRR